LARSALGGNPDEAFCVACRDATDGNPLFLRALLDMLADEGIAPSAEHAARAAELGPEAVSRAIALRLLRLPADAMALVRAAAVLGDGATLAQARALAGLEPPVAAEAAEALARSDLMRLEGPLEFVHPVVRSAVYREMGALARM